MAKQFNIAVLPGDGIGIEVMAEALRVLEAVRARLQDISLELREYEVGAGAYLKHGQPLPEATFRACQEADAILLGAMGLPAVRWPNGKELTPQIDLRERLDLYCGLRPIRLFHPSDTPLKNRGSQTIDLLLVRENCEGLFSARNSSRSSNGEAAEDVLRITRQGSERLFRAAFQQAAKRRGHVTLVDKANVLPSMVFFRQVFDQVAEDYPQVRTDRIYVDAMALYLVQSPQRFDVIVTENMFGDILSDLAAGLVGGMGMAPSADLGDRHALFQPSHGSAPDIAGKGIANPIATLLSVAMMLEHLAHPETVRGAGMIRRAVEAVLADPLQRTSDLGGKLSTTQMTQNVIDNLGGNPSAVGEATFLPSPPILSPTP